MFPQPRVQRHGIGQAAACVAQPALGLNTERDAVAGDKSEEPQDHEGIASAGSLLEIDASVHQRKFFIRGARAPLLKRAVKRRTFSGKLFQHLPRVPMDAGTASPKTFFAVP